jgi:hypothetical protein
MTPDFESLPGIPAGTPVSVSHIDESGSADPHARGFAQLAWDAGVAECATCTDCDPRYALNSERRILLVIHRDDCARYAFRRAQAFDPA